MLCGGSRAWLSEVLGERPRIAACRAKILAGGFAACCCEEVEEKAEVACEAVDGRLESWTRSSWASIRRIWSRTKLILVDISSHYRGDDSRAVFVGRITREASGSCCLFPGKFTRGDVEHQACKLWERAM